MRYRLYIFYLATLFAGICLNAQTTPKLSLDETVKYINSVSANGYFVWWRYSEYLEPSEKRLAVEKAYLTGSPGGGLKLIFETLDSKADGFIKIEIDLSKIHQVRALQGPTRLLESSNVTGLSAIEILSKAGTKCSKASGSGTSYMRYHKGDQSVERLYFSSFEDASRLSNAINYLIEMSNAAYKDPFR